MTNVRCRSRLARTRLPRTTLHLHVQPPRSCTEVRARASRTCATRKSCTPTSANLICSRLAARSVRGMLGATLCWCCLSTIFPRSAWAICFFHLAPVPAAPLWWPRARCGRCARSTFHHRVSHRAIRSSSPRNPILMLGRAGQSTASHPSSHPCSTPASTRPTPASARPTPSSMRPTPAAARSAADAPRSAVAWFSATATRSCAHS